MSTNRLQHWTAPMASPSTRTGSRLPRINTTTMPLPTHHPLDLNKADLTFPPVRQPTMPLRRYTRRLHPDVQRPIFMYHVSAFVYNVIWLLVLVLHLICALHLGFIGGAQFYLLGTTLLGYLTLYGITVDAFYLPPIGVAYFMVCGLHAFSVVTILFHSLRSHRSAFTSTAVLTRTVTTPVMRLRRMSLTALSSVDFRTQSMLERLPSPFVRWCYRLWHALTKLYDSTDLKNECYYSVYVTRHLVQSLVHLYQLFMSSVFLPQPHINTTWVLVFAINCFVPPLVPAFFCSNAPRTRLFCVLINLTLDMTALVVLPATVAYPYVVNFDIAKTNYPRSFWYTDVWFIRAVNEIRSLSVITPLDFLTKMIIAMNVWRSLRVISIIVKIETPEEVTPTLPPSTVSVRAAPSGEPQSFSHENSAQNMVPIQPSGRCNVGVVSSLVIVVMGVFALTTHMHANAWPSKPFCRLPLQTWFASKPACSFLEYQCLDRDQIGSANELASFFEQFAPDLVSYVSIRHCASVEMPRELHTFRNLLAIKVYKSTIARWDEDAAVTASTTFDLRLIYLVDVQLPEFPRGLMSNDFPSRLLDIEIYRTNLTSFPEDLDQYWSHQAMTIALEDIRFTDFPSTITRLQPAALSLAKSGFTSLPVELFDNPELRYLNVNDNPLTTFPVNVTPSAKFGWLAIHGTNISTISSAFALARIDAYDSPLCAPTLSSIPSNLTDLVCTPPTDLFDETMYPYAFEELLNGK